MGCPVLENERGSESSRQVQIKEACVGPESQCISLNVISLLFFLLFRYDTAVKSKMLKYHVKANLWYVCRRVL